MSDHIRFRAMVESAHGGGHVVEVDPMLASAIGARHQTRVRGTFAGAEYRSNLVFMGGRLVLGVHKSTLGSAGVAAGDTVDVTMAADDDAHPHDETPADLGEALAADADARIAWEALAPSRRRRIVASVVGATREETRERRVHTTIAELREAAR